MFFNFVRSIVRRRIFRGFFTRSSRDQIEHCPSSLSIYNVHYCRADSGISPLAISKFPAVEVPLEKVDRLLADTEVNFRVVG